MCICISKNRLLRDIKLETLELMKKYPIIRFSSSPMTTKNLFLGGVVLRNHLCSIEPLPILFTAAIPFPFGYYQLYI